MAFTPLTSRKTTQATIRNLISVLMNRPYWMATSSLALVAGSSGLSTHCRCAKSMPDSSRPIGGITTLSTRLLTMSLKAAPTITPTARSMTLPRAMNSRNSPKIPSRTFRGSLMADLFVGEIEPLAQFLAALEEGHVLGADVNRFAGARVASGAGVARTHRKRPEAAQLHPAAGFQRLDHPLQNHPDHALYVALRQVRILFGEFGDQFRFDHAAPSNRRDHGRVRLCIQGVKRLCARRRRSVPPRRPCNRGACPRPDAAAGALRPARGPGCPHRAASGSRRWPSPRRRR